MQILMTLHRARVLLLASCAIILIGCANTERELLQAQVMAYDRAISSSSRTLEELKAGAPGDYDVKLFVSYDTINQALSAVSGYKINLPNDASTTIILRSAQVEGMGAFPSVLIHADAIRGKDLSANVDLRAALIPGADANDLKLGLFSFVPRVSWRSIEVTRLKFIRDLIAVKAEQLTDKMPTVKLPLQKSLTLGGPASSQNTTFPVAEAKLTVAINTPATLVRANLKGPKYFFVGSGVFIFCKADV